jgi:hypothetical protein
MIFKKPIVDFVSKNKWKILIAFLIYIFIYFVYTFISVSCVEQFGAGEGAVYVQHPRMQCIGSVFSNPQWYMFMLLGLLSIAPLIYLLIDLIGRKLSR